MKNDKLSNILGLYLAGALVVAGAAFVLIIKPTYKQSVKTKAEVAAQRVKINNLKQLDNDTVALRANYDKIRSKRDQILSQLPAKSEEERLLALLSQLSQQNGVIMSSFSPGGAPSSETASLTVYGASVSISGSYATIQSFLRSLEYTARFIDVQSVSLSSGDKSSAGASITLQAYYQQPVVESTPSGGKNGK